MDSSAENTHLLTRKAQPTRFILIRAQSDLQAIEQANPDIDFTNDIKIMLPEGVGATTGDSVKPSKKRTWKVFLDPESAEKQALDYMEARQRKLQERRYAHYAPWPAPQEALASVLIATHDQNHDPIIKKLESRGIGVGCVASIAPRPPLLTRLRKHLPHVLG